MALPTYSTGTVSVSEDGTVVTGSGTIWSGLSVVAGDMIVIDGAPAILITDVTDITHLSIPPWPGAGTADVPYVIYQCSPLRFEDVQIALDLQKQVRALNTTGFEVFVADALIEPDPSIGDNGQYAFQPTTGKRWRKDAGAWTYLGISNPAFSRYDIAIDVPARPASGGVLGKWVAPSLVTFKAGLVESAADADTPATGEAAFSIRKNGVEFATATFDAAGTTATFACATDTEFVSGDVLTLVAPVRDETLANIAFTIVGFR